MRSLAGIYPKVLGLSLGIWCGCDIFWAQVGFVKAPKQIENPTMKFSSTDAYVATDDLTMAVNAAVTLERPLLVKGEPGTGKTELARQVAQALGLPLIEWHVKSTTKAQQGLYEYDAVSRLRDSQLGDARVNDVRNYIRKGKLWQAFEADGRVVLLIDEIDKADIEFPNDLLQELDRMEFHVYETGETIRAAPPRRHHHLEQREGAARRLPAPLLLPLHPLSRCRDAEAHRRVHFPDIKDRLLTAALTQFYETPRVPGLKKKPSTSEVLDWLRSLAEDLAPEDLRKRPAGTALPRLHGALLKNEQDVHLFERLAFMARRRLWTAYLEFYESSVPEEVYRVYFERLLGDDPQDFSGLIAEVDGRPVGLTHYVFHRHGWRVENVCYLQDLYADPEVRGRGVGRALIEAVYAEADRRGCPQVYWMTQHFNDDARRLYDRIGVLTPFIKYQRF
jgi:MoxR-like ATPase/GNAT superfamily N-acetyltransferase